MKKWPVIEIPQYAINSFYLRILQTPAYTLDYIKIVDVLSLLENRKHDPQFSLNLEYPDNSKCFLPIVQWRFDGDLLLILEKG